MACPFLFEKEMMSHHLLSHHLLPPGEGRVNGSKGELAS